MRDDDDTICGQCNGSGEGMHDGSTCSRCKGSGVARDYDTEYESQCAKADYENDQAKQREFDNDF